MPKLFRKILDFNYPEREREKYNPQELNNKFLMVLMNVDFSTISCCLCVYPFIWEVYETCKAAHVIDDSGVAIGSTLSSSK